MGFEYIEKQRLKPHRVLSRDGSIDCVIMATNQYIALRRYWKREEAGRIEYIDLPSFCTQSKHRKPTVSFKGTWLQAVKEQE